MSCPHIVWALREGKSRKLSAHERLILMVLAERANGEMFCWPSVDLLREDTGASRRTVQNALRRLDDLGLIRIEERIRQTSIYHVNRPREDAPAAPRSRAPRASSAPVAPSSCAPVASPPAPSAPLRAQELPFEGAPDAHESPRESPKRESPNTENSTGTGIVVGSSTRAGARASRARQLPKGWYPSEAGVAYAKQHGLNRDDVEHFRDHHTARGNTMLDWDAAWRTWCRNAKRYQARDRSIVPANGGTRVFDPNKLSGAPRLLWEIQQERRAAGLTDNGVGPIIDATILEGVS
jgi:hypothetical protein